MDWHLIISALGFGVSTSIFVWKMGAFTSRLETILGSLKDEVKEMKKNATDIARLDERLNGHETRLVSLETKK